MRVLINGPLQLCIDSKLTVQGAGLWAEKWEYNGLRTRTGKKVKNADQWAQLREALQDWEQDRTRRVQFIHVSSHVGLLGNEEADKLADEGVRKHPKLRGRVGRDATTVVWRDRELMTWVT